MREKNTTDIFILILITTATLLITIPEFLYMKDIYPDHYRANTMFKLVFQAFILLSICTGYIIIRTISDIKYHLVNNRMKIVSICYILVVTILLTLVFTYPYFAITSYYAGFKDDIDTHICHLSTPLLTQLHIVKREAYEQCFSRTLKYQGLNGLTYLKNRSVTDKDDDYEAISWINTYIKGQPTILEAQGDSYSEHERISANTGLPTVLGWFVHEWLWRGEEIPKPRSEDVKLLYESDNIDVTRNLLKKYNVRYVIVGDLERQRYTNIVAQKFQQLGTQVFKAGNTLIYQIL
jgi:uncharacterized membrane protein